ncbi:glycine cleavage system protein GcvH [Thiolinea disciformis]|uniref:glycine cleavage system protein GcvH n=1 Tax=Thiolinea disciformis TaxID=125614 RepID=UPI000366FA9B|nr:glycine cleavage system protein GcvH [Thiolinea disciformis]
MSKIPSELKYTTSHEWVRDNGDGTITVGITDHAQELLGDLVHIELPEVEAEFGAEDALAVAESVKAASDIYAPVAGVVVDINDAVLDNPELVNSDPYGDGWLFTLRVEDMDVLDSLLDAETYASSVDEA